jgi:hypothetical protein
VLEAPGLLQLNLFGTHTPHTSHGSL